LKIKKQNILINNAGAGFDMYPESWTHIYMN
jgi:hypothetical protein